MSNVLPWVSAAPTADWGPTAWSGPRIGRPVSGVAAGQGVTCRSTSIDGDDGLLTLHEAVRQADETSGADTITLATGAEYVLDEPCGQIQDGDEANLLDDSDNWAQTT